MSNLITSKLIGEKSEHSNSFYHALKNKIIEAEKKTINSFQNIQDSFVGKDAQLIAAKRAEIMSNLEEKYFEEAEIRRLLSRMSDEKTGVKLRKHSWKGAKGFTGSEAVDWLTNDIHSWSRHKASRFCQILMDHKAIIALKEANPENAANLDLFQDKKTRGFTFTWLLAKRPKKKDKKGEQPDLDEVPSGSQRDYPTHSAQPNDAMVRARSESFDHSLKSSVTFPLGNISHAKSDNKTVAIDKTDKVEHRRRSIDADNQQKAPSILLPNHHRSASIASTQQANQTLKSPKHATILTTSAEEKTESTNKRSNGEKEERQRKRASKSSKHTRLFKCFLDDDVRLLTIEAKQLTAQYLLAQVLEEYNRERLVIKFMDEDGDLIRITKQQDLDYFLALYGHHKALKLFVFEDKGLLASGTMYSPSLSQSSQHLNESKRSDDSGDSTDYELTDSVDISKPHSGNSVAPTNGSNGNASSNSKNAYYVTEASQSLSKMLPTSGSSAMKQASSNGSLTSPRERLSGGNSYMWEIPKEQLVFGQVLGKGFFGEVRKGKWRGSDVAIKIIYRESFKEKNDEDLFIREVEILTKLRHPRVILFLGAVLSPECKAIVTEFMKGGSLYDLLHNPYQRQKHLPTNYQKLMTAIEIAQGMGYLHGIPILHRDLSCRNILMDEKYRAKVADFGLSKLKHDNKTVSTTLGAVPWMSPEVIRGQVFTEKADVYSFGVVLWEMLTSKDPCPTDKSTLQLADMIAHHGYRPPVPEDCPVAWKKLM
eukprot:TRINITY_DN5168_c0_g1_i1.p1 TRINITY_DN5168_c0_g1~~TRINITY_DN5168_c0_g1_i1.p1  ORF type:complete len:765 (-),score=122.55 TRINITY_DN5168_c0_g1_i1:390-2684(-)